MRTRRVATAPTAPVARLMRARWAIALIAIALIATGMPVAQRRRVEALQWRVDARAAADAARAPLDARR